jgi:hypothetical protein
MIHRQVCLAAAILFLVGTSSMRAADDETPVFSGPQVGEKLTPFKVRGVFNDRAGKEFDLVAEADGKPIVLIFVHETTRPSIGLTRAVMTYAASRAGDGLNSGVIYVTGDATETEAFLKRASHAMPEKVAIGISLDGKEGPGAYGLNRNVTLTVLVAKENKVTANFALVQPSLQADSQKIAKAIVDVLGGGRVPTLAQLGVTPAAADPAANQQDPNLRSLLVPLIQKTASAEEVEKAAAKIEEYLAKNPETAKQVGQIARRIIDAGVLENYGTPAAQEYLRKWAKQFPAEQPRQAQR